MIQTVFALLALTTTSTALAGSGRQVFDADTIIWVGLDYSQARFIGTSDFTDVGQVTTYYPDTWNGLVVNELPEKMGRAVKKRVVFDIAGIAAVNDAVSVDQILREEGGVDQSHLDAAAIAALLPAYQLEQPAGVGMVLVVDRLVKLDETGCGWLTFFDVESRELLYTERLCERAAGFGFRNYWFKPYKTMLTDTVAKVMKTIKRK